MTNDNSNPVNQKILALCPNRKVIGAALVDGVGIARVWLLRLNQTATVEEAIAKARAWLAEILCENSPSILALERFGPKNATRVNLALAGVLECTAANSGCDDTERVDSGEALAAVIRERSLEVVKEPVRVSLRRAATCLALDCPELRIHRPPESRFSRDWERTWGQVVKAAAMALYVREKRR